MAKNITITDELLGAFTEGNVNAEEAMAVITAARKDPNIKKILELSFDIDADMQKKAAITDSDKELARHGVSEYYNNPASGAVYKAEPAGLSANGEFQVSLQPVDPFNALKPYPDSTLEIRTVGGILHDDGLQPSTREDVMALSGYLMEQAEKAKTAKRTDGQDISDEYGKVYHENSTGNLYQVVETFGDQNGIPSVTLHEVNRASDLISEENTGSRKTPAEAFENSVIKTVEELHSPEYTQLSRGEALMHAAEKDVTLHDRDYMLLDRLASDNKYYLGNGFGHAENLWAGNVYAQIEKMRSVYDTLPEKPEWCTKDDIDKYEHDMTAVDSLMAFLETQQKKGNDTVKVVLPRPIPLEYTDKYGELRKMDATSVGFDNAHDLKFFNTLQSQSASFFIAEDGRKDLVKQLGEIQDRNESFTIEPVRYYQLTGCYDEIPEGLYQSEEEKESLNGKFRDFQDMERKGDFTPYLSNPEKYTEAEDDLYHTYLGSPDIKNTDTIKADIIYSDNEHVVTKDNIDGKIFYNAFNVKREADIVDQIKQQGINELYVTTDVTSLAERKAGHLSTDHGIMPAIMDAVENDNVKYNSVRDAADGKVYDFTLDEKSASPGLQVTYHAKEDTENPDWHIAITYPHDDEVHHHIFDQLDASVLSQDIPKSYLAVTKEKGRSKLSEEKPATPSIPKGEGRWHGDGQSQKGGIEFHDEMSQKSGEGLSQKDDRKQEEKHGPGLRI